jgi:branched-chain amino acid transport system ATP-binding protein
LARELDDAARRRLTIACAMVCEPIVMLLDEPFGAMPRGAADSLRKVLAQFVRRCNVATIVAERDPVTCAGLCDRIIVLHAGRTIAEGSFAALKSNEDVLDAYVGVEWRQ